MEAVKQEGHALQDASMEMRGDREVVRQAVKSSTPWGRWRRACAAAPRRGQDLLVLDMAPLSMGLETA
eukprot:16045116-Heterocapsa_arctica.AAC.1